TIVGPAPRARRTAESLRHGRIHVKHESAREPAQSVESAGLPQKGCIRALRRRPRIFVSGVLYFTDDVDVPALFVARLILEALERNPDLDFVAVRSQPPFRREDEIL